MGVGENVSKAVNTPVVSPPAGESVSKAVNSAVVTTPVAESVGKALNTVVTNHGHPFGPTGTMSVSKAINTVVLRHAPAPLPPVSPTGFSDLIIYDTSYQRWRNQSYPASTLFYEDDTNLLLFAVPETGPAGSGYSIRQLAYQDFQDGGWVAGVLARTPIPLVIQIPFQDLGKP